MKVEKLFYKGVEVKVPILEENEIEQNENFDNDELEKTLEISEKLKNKADNNE